MLDPHSLQDFVDQQWGQDILPCLEEYIRIPNKSPLFDPQWAEHGHMDAAVELFRQWAQKHVTGITGARVEVERLPGRTPLLVVDVPAQRRVSEAPVILYGHLDKQPEMSGWAEGLGPWTPVRREDRLYGRGGADDGYALFASLTALLALRAQNQPHARCVFLIEASEESGSRDLTAYIEYLQARIGTPELVICLDSSCGSYERLWLTTSLRGHIAGNLSVQVLSEGVHSGLASGVVPSSFRILRQLLSRLENEISGEIHPADFHVSIPAHRIEQAGRIAALQGDAVFENFPLSPGMRPTTPDITQLILNRTWRPQLSVTGCDGMPPTATAGNVLRPYTTAKLSLRVPPGLNIEVAAGRLKSLLESEPPYGAQVKFEITNYSTGWDAPANADWLDAALNDAGQTFFGNAPAFVGEGGAIPFMGMLGQRFPKAQFVVSGVLGPHSNAHGPNEFLHIPTAKRLTAVIAMILHRHAGQSQGR